MQWIWLVWLLKIPKVSPTGQCGDRLHTQHGFIASRSTDNANYRRQLRDIDRSHFGDRSGWSIDTSLLTHDGVVRIHRWVCCGSRRHISGCNHMLGLTGCCVYANYAAGYFIGATAHTCNAIEQRLLVVVGTENFEHRRSEVFVHFFGRTLSVNLSKREEVFCFVFF